MFTGMVEAELQLYSGAANEPADFDSFEVSHFTRRGCTLAGVVVPGRDRVDDTSYAGRYVRRVG